MRVEETPFEKYGKYRFLVNYSGATVGIEWVDKKTGKITRI